MVLLVMVLKAATIATIQFASMDDCEAAKKALVGGTGAMSTELSVVCIDKVQAATPAQ